VFAATYEIRSDTVLIGYNLGAIIQVWRVAYNMRHIPRTPFSIDRLR